MTTVGPWICDHCGEPIQAASDGYVLWESGAPGSHQARSFKIVHTGRCDDRSLPKSMPLTAFVGVDGLSYALALLSPGPIQMTLGRPAYADHPVMEDFVDFVRRVQIPSYEQARIHFDNPALLEERSDQSESAPYRQKALEDIARSFGTPEA